MLQPIRAMNAFPVPQQNLHLRPSNSSRSLSLSLPPRPLGFTTRMEVEIKVGVRIGIGSEVAYGKEVLNIVGFGTGKFGRKSCI